MTNSYVSSDKMFMEQCEWLSCNTKIYVFQYEQRYESDYFIWHIALIYNGKKYEIYDQKLIEAISRIYNEIHNS